MNFNMRGRKVKDSLKHLIYLSQRRLELLKEKKAIQGINTDPAILIEIEGLENDISTLQTDLSSLQDVSSVSNDVPKNSSTEAKSSWTPSVITNITHIGEDQAIQIGTITNGNVTIQNDKH